MRAEIPSHDVTRREALKVARYVTDMTAVRERWRAPSDTLRRSWPQVTMNWPANLWTIEADAAELELAVRNDPAYYMLALRLLDSPARTAATSPMQFLHDLRGRASKGAERAQQPSVFALPYFVLAGKHPRKVKHVGDRYAISN